MMVASFYTIFVSLLFCNAIRTNWMSDFANVTVRLSILRYQRISIMFLYKIIEMYPLFNPFKVLFLAFEK